MASRIVLALEVEVDRAGGDARAARHVGDLRVEEAAVGEDVDRGAEDRVVLIATRRSSGTDRGHGSH
jgi:hypothetical protein